MIRVQVGGRHGAPRLLELHEDLAVEAELIGQDRKSTRLNSSHLGISYAVFCLKKKKKYKITRNNHNKKSKIHIRTIKQKIINNHSNKIQVTQRPDTRYSTHQAQ